LARVKDIAETVANIIVIAAGLILLGPGDSLRVSNRPRHYVSSSVAAGTSLTLPGSCQRAGAPNRSGHTGRLTAHYSPFFPIKKGWEGFHEDRSARCIFQVNPSTRVAPGITTLFQLSGRG